MVEKEIVYNFLKSSIIIFLCFCIYSCSNDETYDEKVDKVNEEFIEDKKELMTKIVVEQIEDSTSSENSIKKLNELETNYEDKINELNDLFSGQEVISPFEISKTTDVELAGYGMQVDLNIKNRTVFNVILNKIVGWLFEVAILALFVIALGFLVNYSRPFALIRVLLSHWIIVIIFFAIGVFFSPAEYFGLINSDIENETEKIIDLSFEKKTIE